jgi:uncharacterized membrane protein YphA (DoxX/SURF4 family)
MTRRIIVVLRVLLAVVFLYAAYTKLRQPWLVFAMSIDAYGLLPEWGVLAMARSLPWIEVAIGILLLTGLGLRYISLLATIVLATFFTVMLRSFGKGMGIDCGCFGVGEALTAKSLARDGLLLAGAVALTVLAFRTRASKELAGPRHLLKTAEGLRGIVPPD